MDPFLWMVPISVSRGCRPRLPQKHDLESLRNFLKHVNIRDMVKALQTIGFLDRRLDSDSITSKEIFQFLVFEVHCFESVDDLARRLFDHGFHNLARILYLHYLQTKYKSNSLVTVKRSVPPNKKTIHIFFKNLKRLVHNAQFKNPREFFRKQAQQLRSQIGQERTESKRQFLTDKYIALLGAEIDAIAITYDTTLPDQNIFEELKALVGSSTDASISEVVFYGRKANALAIAKKFSEGENMVKQAHCCANFTGPCLEIANMIYIDVYFKLWQFEQAPTDELKESLLFEGSKGLWALSEEEEEIRNLWKRMFLLRMIFCLIGLSNKGRCIPGCVISKEDVERAERYMHEIDLKDIEARREMMYYIAKARIQELKGQFYDACFEIDKASEIAHSGNFKEIDSINDYRSLLKDLDSETEAKTINEVESDDLAEAPALISSLESLELIDVVSFTGTETAFSDRSCNSPESRPFSDLSMDSTTENTWSVLGGQFPSASSPVESELTPCYPQIRVEPVQETGVQVIPRSSLNIQSAPDLRNSSVLRHQNDVINSETRGQEVTRTSSYSSYDIPAADNIKLSHASFEND